MGCTRSFIKRQTSDKSSDNEWQQVVQRMTTSDNEWYNEWERMTTSGSEWQKLTISDSKWYNESNGTVHFKE